MTQSHTLSRDIPATIIPAGTPVTLAAGTVVYITQTLGGNVTVRTDLGLLRIARENTDAISGYAPAPVSGESADAPAEFSEQAVWDALKTCFDPEIPVNIVDLGLVYDLAIERGATGAAAIEVKMTLTAPGCGMGPTIAADARSRILTLPGVESAEVELVWDPAWNQAMISEAGKMKLGLI